MVISNILKEMIIILCQKLFQYINQKMTKLSTSEDFKARYYIKKYKQYKKLRVIDLIAIKEKLQEIQEIVEPYINEDIYNINQSTLF